MIFIIHNVILPAKSLTFQPALVNQQTEAIPITILAILSSKTVLNGAVDSCWSFYKHKVHVNTRESDPTVPQSELLLTTGHSPNAIKSNAISSPTCTTLRNTCCRCTGSPFQILAKSAAQEAGFSQYAYLDRLCVCGCLRILPCNGGVGLWCNLVYDMIKG